MGNLHFLPLDNEEDLNNLFLEFSWLEERGELIRESRISFDFKVIDEERKCYDIYRFFGGLNKFLKSDHDKEFENTAEKLDSPAPNSDNDIFNEIFLQNSLKYFPSLNGMIFGKNEDNIINKIRSAIKMQRNIKKDIYPNIIFYEQVITSNNYIYTKRIMWESTIKDKLDELPKINFLNIMLKHWLEFQSLMALVQLHSLGIFHGDIKTENMLVNHLYTVKITDISPWKPIFIDSSDLRFWTVFFENQNCNARSNVLSCNLSPERFLLESDIKRNVTLEPKCEIKNKLFRMDIFSLGCILNEIESEETTFTINDILNMLKLEKYRYELNNKININWIKEIFLSCTSEKRPDAFETLLKLLDMNRVIKVKSLNTYLFSHSEEKNFHFCKSFPLFFYPLSIIMQNRIFNDVRIQIIILNIILPIFLELFIIKKIYLNNVHSDDQEDYIDFEKMFSNLEIEYTIDWNLNKLKSTFQNKYDYELMKDLILTILISDLDHQIFDEKTKLENINSNNYSNIKGFFSIFQLLLNCWDYKKVEFSANFNLIHYINYIILGDGHQLNTNDLVIQENKKSFFALIKKNNTYIEDYNSVCTLYVHFINISLRRLTHFYENKCKTNNLDMFEIYNSIYLLTINTLNILLEILSEQHKKEIAVKEILPTIIQFLSINEYPDEISFKLIHFQLNFQSINSTNHNLIDLHRQYNKHKEPIVIFEIFNFINYSIMKYVRIENEELVTDEINKIINDLIIVNIEKWIYLYIILNNTLVVSKLLEIASQVLILIIKNKKNKLNIWITEILTSDNSTLKKLIVKGSKKNKSILFKILDYFLSTNKTEVFISEILPYLIDQLNDRDIQVKCEFCKIIIHMMEKMETIFILPYGKFCIEKCLSDKEFYVKLAGLKSANKILKRIVFAENKKLGVNESEVIIHEIIESIVNNLKSILFIKYYPLNREFANTLKCILKYSKKYNNWLVFFLLLNKFFRVKEMNFKYVLNIFKLIEFSKIEFLIYYKNLFKNHPKCIDEKDEKFTSNSEASQTKPPFYTELILYSLPCLLNQLSLYGDFEEIVFISSLIQKEAKYNIRKHCVFNVLRRLTKQKNMYNKLCEPDFKKPKPTIKGKYLGSIYNHSKLVCRYDNNTNIGAGFNIYQKLLYINEEVYSCSTNNSINAGIYLHKLNVYDKLHYWNLITDQFNNYIFKFNNNSYVTSMMALSNEFSIVTGNNIGILSKINIDRNIVTTNENYFKDENLLFKQNTFLISKSTMIILVGKININSKELIVSAYSNGDICIIDSENLITEITFSIPPFLGNVIDYSTDNDTNSHLICFVTDENTVIIIDLFYLKTLKIWKINHELNITNISNSYFNHSSLKFMLTFKNGIFALFDPINGQINSNVDLTFQITEIKERLIHIYSPFLFSSKIIHPEGFECLQKCNCLYCQTQRVRIFGNYLNQYVIMNRFHNCLVKKERLVSRNIIGPLTTHMNNIDKNQCINKYYIFNDDFGNVYQQNFPESDLCCQTNSLDCIINKYSAETSLIDIKNNKNNGHKDLITSLNIYSFSNNEMGLFTSSRDGIISYWN
ncbi:kinase with WD40 repeat at C-terminus [Cryptosporidium sp. chipmunk genotype I]|uniref:kinase with WD40 repeat at C-terminus n=1 Tax=Cryptosporidium sp. chipmunk genotype I TaxID=1280935 RepID=UPI00351AA3B6|nr:kinase with WD40 repeat at C-terminus [Cryptosporidium sp. chipmunk genotype I]